MYVGYSHTAGVTGGYVIISVKKIYVKIHFHVYNQKFILYVDLSYHSSVKEMVNIPCPDSSRACSLVENYSPHLWKTYPEPMSSTMLGLSHLSSFITHRGRDGIIHFSDDETQDHC